MLDAVERPYRFHRLPTRPPHFEGGSLEVCLVAHESGVLTGMPGLDAIRALPSYLCEESGAPCPSQLPWLVYFSHGIDLTIREPTDDPRRSRGVDSTCLPSQDQD